MSAKWFILWVVLVIVGLRRTMPVPDTNLPACLGRRRGSDAQPLAKRPCANRPAMSPAASRRSSPVGSPGTSQFCRIPRGYVSPGRGRPNPDPIGAIVHHLRPVLGMKRESKRTRSLPSPAVFLRERTLRGQGIEGTGTEFVPTVSDFSRAFLWPTAGRREDRPLLAPRPSAPGARTG